jgi:hypothetical protein
MRAALIIIITDLEAAVGWLEGFPTWFIIKTIYIYNQTTNTLPLYSNLRAGVIKMALSL